MTSDGAMFIWVKGRPIQSSRRSFWLMFVRGKRR